MSGFNVEEHFPVKGKTIEMPNGATKEVIDYKLSRYACYLIVQNASPARHKSVALGQTYFAVQTRKMELTQEEYNKLNEDEKRLYTRINIKNKNKYLFDTAKKAGVNNYAKFNDYGYKGLYGGETAKDIAKRKGIDPDKEEILDHMGSNELAANLFRITQTDEVIKNNNITKILTIFFFLISLFSIGSRAYGLNILLFIGSIINIYYCRFRILQLMVVLVPIFIFMSVISITRLSPVNFSNSSVLAVFEYSYDYIISSKDAFVLLFTDFIVNNRNLYEEIDYSIKYGLLFGQTYIPYLFVIVPFGATLFSNYFLGKDLRQLNTGALITDMNGAEVGLGSNVVGDLYMNFSYIGTFVVFFLFGLFVNYVMKSTSFYGRLLYFTLIAFSIYIPRADILSWLSLFMLMILFLYLRRVYVSYISILIK